MELLNIERETDEDWCKGKQPKCLSRTRIIPYPSVNWLIWPCKVKKEGRIYLDNHEEYLVTSFIKYFSKAISFRDSESFILSIWDFS